MGKEIRKQQDAIAIKPYKKDATYSYTLGAFPTIELIKCRPEKVMKVLVHSTFTEKETEAQKGMKLLSSIQNSV